MIRLLTFPFRLVYGSARAGWYAGRAVGAGRALFFGAGFAVGVLVASPSARRFTVKGVAKGVVAVRERHDDDVPSPPSTSAAATPLRP